jgi:hypothetical protein
MIAFTFLDQSGVGTKRHPHPIGYEDLPIGLGQSIHLTPKQARKCVGALIRFEGGPFRVRMDGGAPVSTLSILTASGYLRSDGDEYFCSKEEAQAIVTILDVNGPLPATEGILRVTYYG